MVFYRLRKIKLQDWLDSLYRTRWGVFIALADVGLSIALIDSATVRGNWLSWVLGLVVLYLNFLVYKLAQPQARVSMSLVLDTCRRYLFALLCLLFFCP